MKEPSRAFNQMNDAQLSFFEDLNGAIFDEQPRPEHTPPGWNETIEQAQVDAAAIAEVRADQ